MAVKTCKKDCSPENKDKFLSEAGMSGGAASFWGSSAAPCVLWGTGVPVGWLGWESGHGLSLPKIWGRIAIETWITAGGGGGPVCSPMMWLLPQIPVFWGKMGRKSC